MNTNVGLSTWAVTAASAAAGAVVLNIAAPTIVALLATIAAPPVALTLGAVGGGAAGWRYMNGRNESKAVASSVA